MQKFKFLPYTKKQNTGFKQHYNAIPSCLVERESHNQALIHRMTAEQDEQADSAEWMELALMHV